MKTYQVTRCNPHDGEEEETLTIKATSPREAIYVAAGCDRRIAILWNWLVN